MECPSCHETIADGANFCPFCGRDKAAPAAPAQMRTCPRCGAPNGPHRVLCGRCGADLESGRVGVLAPTSEDEDDELAAEPPPRARSAASDRTSILVVVLAVGAIIGILVGGIVWLGLLDAEGARSPVFDPGVYPEPPGPVAVAGVTPTSVRPPDGDVRFDAANLIDGDATTLWAPAEASTGVGLTARLSEPAWVSALTVQLPDAPADARRPTELLVTFTDRARFVVAYDDRSGAQRVELPAPVLTRGFEIEVVDLGPGTGPLAVAEIAVEGWEARGVDRERAT